MSLLALAVLAEWGPAPAHAATHHTLRFGIPTLHLGRYRAHQGDAGTTVDETVAVAPGFEVGYGHRLTPWFDIGLALGYQVAPMDPGLVHRVAIGVTPRAVVTLLDGDLELSAGLNAGAVVFRFESEATWGFSALGVLGVLGHVTKRWCLYAEARGGYAMAPQNAADRYDQQAETWLELVLGAAFRF